MINEQLHNFLSAYGLDTEMYKAMETDDMADAVEVALHVINMLPTSQHSKIQKSDLMSEHFRSEGNKAYKAKHYQKTLILYNKAILHAPTGSESMVFAYSNRSALLLTVNANTFCLKDIETCLNMDCSPTLRDKLHKRKQCALDTANTEKDLKSALFPAILLDNFFKFKAGLHPQLSSISNDIDFEGQSQKKVIAKNQIEVGSVLALDTAFIITVSPDNHYISCHYCSKLSLNLMPCDECCSVLFCSNECKNCCWDEYHSIECKIENLYNEVFQNPRTRLPLKAALKMKTKCKSWKEMEMASKKMGADRIAASTIHEIYSWQNMFNLLNCMNDRHFIHGKIYNGSFSCAMVVTFLEKIPGFFPSSTNEKLAAIRAFSRILMFLMLFPATTQIITATSCLKHWGCEVHVNINHGWFPFISKLRHRCEPNTLAISLNNKIALIALKPIAPGTEITTSYIGHLFENKIDGMKRKIQLWNINSISCSCLICSQKWKNTHHKMTLHHEQFLKKIALNMHNIFLDKYTYNNSDHQTILSSYTNFIKVLESFSDICYSAEYINIYTAFRQCLIRIEVSITQNIILGHK